MNVQQMTKNLGGMLRKNSPTILTGLAVAGLVSTTVLAVRATPKAVILIGETMYEKNKTVETGAECPRLTKRETIMATYKCYIPAALMGVATIGCIIGANSISLRRNAALASVYSLSEAALKEYQSKVVDIIGEKKEREVRDEITKDRLAKNPVSSSEIILTGRGETLCYDELSGRYFKSDIETIRQALNTLSRDMMTDMFITLNDVYYALDLAGTKMGEMLGWRIEDGLLDPKFSTHLADNGQPCLTLDFDTQPVYINMD